MTTGTVRQNTRTTANRCLTYAPTGVLWSDGADKQRFIYLPPGAKIDSTDMDNWVFPVGTKVWKEFLGQCQDLASTTSTLTYISSVQRLPAQDFWPRGALLGHVTAKLSTPRM